MISKKIFLNDYKHIYFKYDILKKKHAIFWLRNYLQIQVNLELENVIILDCGGELEKAMGRKVYEKGAGDHRCVDESNSAVVPVQRIVTCVSNATERTPRPPHRTRRR